eukprot:CAMPEP_0118705752 /NCGR_PEP_ID=MMETSP0800-20121206/20065_1 /TAXON_ID=210618 ORGANISM="Striatella unipunctata, Strain CCMP2910" /NCGR_SAMPLE_ID=MMETSP0800 /ASSEMBLY_ACC=CAM_ASM_000638 /LENGTH=304 /DNA_ID=CAMNT_0006607987 /DNA_START=91 /DNA_END=1005 /DNA_ORIENTATION=+
MMLSGVLQSDSKGSYSHLSQSLVHSEVDEEMDTAKKATATPIVEVVAPSDLAEGYELQVTVNGAVTKIKVPQGGVVKGQRFSAPLPTAERPILSSPELVPPPSSNSSIPVGHWRDDTFDCFKYGFFHAHLWNAMCCTPILLAQLMTRLQLDVLGRPRDIASTTGTFQKILAVVVVFWTSRILLAWIISATTITVVMQSYDSNNNEFVDNEIGTKGSGDLFRMIRDVSNVTYAICVVLVLMNIRKHVRRKFAIPESSFFPKGLEDILCSLFCMGCTAAQIARHNDEQPAGCCTENGINEKQHMIV